MKATCSNCKCALDPVVRHEPFCPRCAEAMGKVNPVNEVRISVPSFYGIENAKTGEFGVGCMACHESCMGHADHTKIKHKPNCPNAQLKSMIDNPTIRPQMGDQGAMGDAVEVNRIEQWEGHLFYAEDSEWSSRLPQDHGMYAMVCAENEFSPELIYVFENRDELCAYSEDCIQTIRRIHGQLGGCQWRAMDIQ